MTVNRIITPPSSIHDSVYDNPAVNSNSNSSKKVNRIKWVDTAKALGLFLVFWGHLLYYGSPVGCVINKAIYSFHMPMYFILSGYILKPESSSLYEYVRKKAKRVLLPALLLYFLTLPLFLHPHYLDYATATPYSVIIEIFYLSGKCAYNGPVWFFFCMFQILIITKLFDLSNAKVTKIFIIAITCLVLSYIFYELKWKYFNLLGFNKCVLGLFFYSFGMLLRRTKYEEYSFKVGISIAPVWLLFGVVLNEKVSMYGMGLGHYWFFIISGITGSLVFFIISKFFENSSTVCTYAKYTIFIVCSHFVLVSFFKMIAMVTSIKGTIMLDFLSAIFVLLSLICYKPVCVYVAKRLPVLIG